MLYFTKQGTLKTFTTVKDEGTYIITTEPPLWLFVYIAIDWFALFTRGVCDARNRTMYCKRYKFQFVLLYDQLRVCFVRTRVRSQKHTRLFKRISLFSEPRVKNQRAQLWQITIAKNTVFLTTLAKVREFKNSFRRFERIQSIRCYGTTLQ